LPTLSIRTAIGNYGHTKPVKDGSTKSDKFGMEQVEVTPVTSIFRRMVRGLEFDVAEMALSTYLCARAHGKAFTVIPIFLVRGFHHGRTAGNLSGGARNVSMVHLTKTLSNHLGRHGITVNCIHPGTTRTERTPGLLAARATQLGITLEEMEQQDFAPDSAQGNAICRMVDASEIGYLTAFLASDKAWAITGELIAAGGGTGNAVFY